LPLPLTDNLFYIDWENPNPNVPRTFVKEDFYRIAISPKLFARKFELTKDPEILELIDQKLLN